MSDPSIDDVADLVDQMRRDLPAAPGTVRRRLRADLHHLEIHVEVDVPGDTCSLTVSSPGLVQDQVLFDAAGLRCEAQAGTIRVRAQSTSDETLFFTLVADLVHEVSAARSRPAAVLVQRLRSWQGMLASGRSPGLSPREQLGLYGELLVMHEVIRSVWRAEAVTSWLGPLGAPQDFARAQVALEVKTVASHHDGDLCRISNERQLDDTDLQYLYLVYQRVEASTTSGVSLPEMVDVVRGEPAYTSERSVLEDRLARAGWLDVHRDRYQATRYSIGSRRIYQVDSSFPRLTPASLPPGVQSVSYSVELGLCGLFMIPEATVLATM